MSATNRRLLELLWMRDRLTRSMHNALELRTVWDTYQQLKLVDSCIVAIEATGVTQDAVAPLLTAVAE